MTDWSASMQQTFEYYLVDPGTWGDRKRLQNVEGGTIKWDSSSSTLGSATFDVTEDPGECYIRIYMNAIQNRVTDTRPLGTFLVQTPSIAFDGKLARISLDAYTPLLELKDAMVPIGYSIAKGTNIMDIAADLTEEHVQAPVVHTSSTKKLSDNFVAGLDDNWLTFLTDLIANAGYHYDLDEMGRILFAPDQDTEALQPVATFNDGNSSILYPDIDISRDLYGIPNVVEVVYSTGSGYLFSRVRNTEKTSPVSTVSRGREVVFRETSPEISSNPVQSELDTYAEQLLRNKSVLEYTLSYTRGYYPIRVGDCVRLNYTRAGLQNVKAKITSQSIRCEPGCPVTETAVFSANLWG